jgi:hypothetical protein
MPILLLALLLLATPAAAQRDEPLRAELLRRLAADQAIRDSVTAALRAGGPVPDALARRMLAVDSANTRWLRPELARLGAFPTRAQVGADGVEAAFLLVQHADHDPAFQEAALPLLERAHAAGDVDGESVALLTDRVLRAQGRPQRYGTQADVVDGAVRLAPIADSAGVDARRRAMGMMALADSKRVLDSVYAPPR